MTVIFFGDICQSRFTGGTHRTNSTKTKRSRRHKFSLFIKIVFMFEYGPNHDMDEVVDHPDRDADASSVIDNQPTLALSDPEHGPSHIAKS